MDLAISTIFMGILMGGNTGSTAGGIKIIRHVIVIKTLFSEFKRILYPNSIISIFIDGAKQKDRVLAFLFCYDYRTIRVLYSFYSA